MSDERYEPTKAEFLAGLITGNASMESSMATVQRSHRFPLHLFWQIENMARMGGVPVSVIINQLLECGIDAVMDELSEEQQTRVRLITPEQLDCPTEVDSADTKKKSRARPKLDRVK